MEVAGVGGDGGRAAGFQRHAAGIVHSFIAFRRVNVNIPSRDDIGGIFHRTLGGVGGYGATGVQCSVGFNIAILLQGNIPLFAIFPFPGHNGTGNLQTAVIQILQRHIAKDGRVGNSGGQGSSGMSSDIYAAIDGVYHNGIAIIVSLMCIHTVCRKFPESVAVVGKQDTRAADNIDQTTRKGTVTILLDISGVGNQINPTTSSVSTGCLVLYYLTRRHRAVENDGLFGVQLHVANRRNLAVDALMVLVAQPDSPFFQIAGAGGHKVALHINETQPHGGILTQAAVDAPDISVLGFKVDEHTIVGIGVGVFIRGSVIIQNTDWIFIGADFTSIFIGLELQDFARVKVTLRILLIGGPHEAFFRFQPNGITGIDSP